MAINQLSLRKLMQLLLADRPQQTSLLRADITSDLRRERNGPGDGGDFHSPFWADAKAHAAGDLDLRDATRARVAAHPGRARLCPLLQQGFLTWWEERRRRRNEPFEVAREQIKGRLVLDGLGTVKVESNLGFSIGGGGYRVIYPYFCERPHMNAEVSRLGLWAMTLALPAYATDDLRILDVLRARSFSTMEAPLDGGEEGEFRSRYRELLDRWEELRLEY